MRFHQDGGLALIVMKGLKPWIMYDGAELKIIFIRHIYGTCLEVITGGGGFEWGTNFAIYWATRFCQSSRFCQNLKVIHNPHQAYMWDCSGVITGRVGFEGEGDTQILPFFDRGAASILCIYSNSVLPRFCQNLKEET